MTSIGEYAFYDCCGLTSIAIPYSVTKIGDSAFYRCSGLTSISYKGTQSQWDAIDKGKYWDDDTDDYVVHCTDGDLKKQ